MENEAAAMAPNASAAIRPGLATISLLQHYLAQIRFLFFRDRECIHRLDRVPPRLAKIARKLTERLITQSSITNSLCKRQHLFGRFGFSRATKAGDHGV